MIAAKDESRSTAKLERLEEALGAYWDCGYQEGHLRRPFGDQANEILHEIRESVKELIEQEREACAKLCDLHSRLTWNDDRKAQSRVLAAEIRRGSNTELSGARREEK